MFKNAWDPFKFEHQHQVFCGAERIIWPLEYDVNIYNIYIFKLYGSDKPSGTIENNNFPRRLFPIGKKTPHDNLDGVQSDGCTSLTSMAKLLEVQTDLLVCTEGWTEQKSSRNELLSKWMRYWKNTHLSVASNFSSADEHGYIILLEIPVADPSAHLSVQFLSFSCSFDKMLTNNRLLHFLWILDPPLNTVVKRDISTKGKECIHKNAFQ